MITKERAIEIVQPWVGKNQQGDDELYNLGMYVYAYWHRKDACLDGEFSADELEAIAMWMRGELNEETNQ